MGIGYGATVTYVLGVGSPVTVGKVRNIEPTLKVDSKDSSSNDSPSRTREKEPGFIDAGTITLSLLYRKTTVTALMALVASYIALPPVIPVWTFTFRDGSTWIGAGFHTSKKHGHQYDDEETMDIDLEASGVWVWVAGAG